MNQQETLREAEQALGLGPVAMAREIGAPYHTYKDWRSGRRNMPGVAFRCVELAQIVRAAGTTL